MNNSYFFITIILFFSYFIGIYSENVNYIVSILREENDKNFEITTKEIQLKIEELVNDRMNDIYDIILENKESYVLENGEQDQMLKELETNPLKKRDNKLIKYLFINNRKRNNHFKRSIDYSNSNFTEYISVESKLVNHICPIKNYYAINAYLSSVTAEIVCNLDNVINCEKSTDYKIEEIKFDKEIKVLNKNIDINKYLNENIDFKLENNSTDVDQRTIYFDPDHLTILSHADDREKSLDNIYYFSTSAGYGIDMYIIDTGLNTDHLDLYDYEDFPFKRNVSCDAVIDFNGVHYTNDDEKDYCVGNFDEDSRNYQNPYHGVAVSSVAAGMIFGAASKANIHMIAVDLSVVSVLRSFDYILLNAKPHKTIINMSFGSSNSPYYKSTEDKLNELIEKGFIIFTSAGNEAENCCASKDSDNFHSITGYRKAITVGAAFGNHKSEGYTIEDYSNYGDCIDIFAPGYVSAAYITEDGGMFSYYPMHGTSFSSPIAAGVAATIMSAYPEYEFDNNSIKNILIDLSHKGTISGLGRNNTPERFIYNGKGKIDTSLIPTEYKCGVGSEDNSICYGGCCSKDSKCILFEDNPGEECLIENGCQSEFGFCTTKEESIKECEKEIKENEECEVVISNEYSENDILSCINIFKLKCAYFYTDLEIGNTCNIAKHFKDFGFVNTFNKRTREKYSEICVNEIYEKYTDQCSEEVKDYKKCLIDDDIFDILRINDINKLDENEIEDLQRVCIDFKTDDCVDFRKRAEEIMLTYNSCRLIKDMVYLDVYHRELFLSTTHNDTFIDFCDKIFEYQSPKCSDKFKEYDECLPIFTNTTTTDELIENCSLIESKKCQSFYEDKNHSINFCNSYVKDFKKYDLINNIEETISNYKDICENNVKEEVKEKVIYKCKEELQNNKCTFKYIPEMTDEEISQKCEIFKSEECQTKYTFSSEYINICKLAKIYNNDIKSMLPIYEGNYFMDNKLCLVSKDEIIAECEDKLIDYDECLLNKNGQNNLYYLCLLYTDDDCQKFYENPYKYVPECRIAERYKKFNIINKSDKNYEFLTEQCPSIIETGIEE